MEGNNNGHNETDHDDDEGGKDEDGALVVVRGVGETEQDDRVHGIWRDC